MAAIPGFSFLYVVCSHGRYKIGFARDLDKRMSAIQSANSFAVGLLMFLRVREDRVRYLEGQMHADLREYWVRGEWFKSPISAIRLATSAIADRFREDVEGYWEYANVPSRVGENLIDELIALEREVEPKGR